MNYLQKKHTAISILFAVLAILVLIAALISIDVITNDVLEEPIANGMESEEPMAAIGLILWAFAGTFYVLMISGAILITAGALSYWFAHLSYKYARNMTDKLKESDKKPIIPWILVVFAIIEMIVAAICSVLGAIMLFSLILM